MKKIFLLTSFLLLVLSSTFAIAQNRDKSELVFGKTYTMNELKDLKGVIKCASTSYEKYLQAKDPKRMTEAQFESWIAPLIENAKANKSNVGGIITIPVVVHVIHSGQPVGTAPNITSNQVKSQITVMNNDFRRAAGTLGYNTSPVGADTMIQFALAKVDPNGNPTDGIDRVNLCKTFFTTDEVNSMVKPQTIWDPNVYMNMWSVNLGGASANILGYAQFPSGSGLPGLNANGGSATTDGVVAKFNTFGSSDYNDGTFMLSAPYDKGRTMTHEVGHFLGLRHIWGDTTCGTDYCADTPTAHTANYTCNKNIASCDNPAINEMVENYMDYTSDTCMNIFTIDQKFRITAVMNNSPRRMQLKTSTADQAIPLFPNDAEVKYEKSCTSSSNITCASSGSPSSFKILFYNRGTSNLTSAVINYSIGGVVQTYNYNGNLAPNTYAEIPFTIAASVPSGVITATVTTVNGVADQRASNNSFSANYVSATPPVVGNGNYTLTLQNDYYGSEVYWELTDSSNNPIYTGGPYSDVANPQTSPLDPPITQTFALANGCYTFTIYDLYGDGISDQGGYYNLKNSANQIVFEGTPYTTSQSRAVNVTVLSTNEAAPTNSFSIYPNPVDDILNIAKVSNKAVYEIYGVSGQLINKGSIKNGKVIVSDLIKGNYIIKITDQEMSSTLKFIKK